MMIVSFTRQGRRRHYTMADGDKYTTKCGMVRSSRLAIYSDRPICKHCLRAMR
jgi:hypothetical protein